MLALARKNVALIVSLCNKWHANFVMCRKMHFLSQEVIFLLGLVYFSRMTIVAGRGSVDHRPKQWRSTEAKEWSAGTYTYRKNLVLLRCSIWNRKSRFLLEIESDRNRDFPHRNDFVFHCSILLIHTAML